MKKRRIIAMLMTVVLILTFLPAVTFAAAEGGQQTLGGELKIKGFPAVGNKLEADLTAVTPAGLTKDKLTYAWTKQEGGQTKTLGTADSYTLAATDQDAVIKLTVTAKAEAGLAGQLAKETGKVSKQGVTPTPAPAVSQAAVPTMTPVPSQGTDVNQQEAGQPQPNVSDSAQNTQPAQEPAESSSGNPSGENAENTPYVPDETVNSGYVPENEIQSRSVPSADVPEQNTEVQRTEGQAGSSENVQAGNTQENTSAEKSTYNLEAEQDTVDFGTLKEGYKKPEPKTATVRNEGTVALTLEGAESKFFTVEGVSGTVLQPGEKADIRISPKEGQNARKEAYEEEIAITTESNVNTVITASFKVEEKASEPGLKIVSGASLDFGSMEEGKELPKAREFEVENTGSGDVAITDYEGEHFEIITELPVTIKEGEKKSLKVQPKKDLKPEKYEESVKLVTDPELKDPLSLSCKLLVEQEKIYDYEISDSSLYFGSRIQGYESVDAKEIVIKNTGNQPLKLTVSKGKDFTVGSLSKSKIDAGESASFTIAPKTGLTAGPYEEDIVIKGQNSKVPEKKVKVSFSVEKQTFKASVTPGTLSFEDRIVGYTQSPAAKNFQIKNTGTGTLTLKKPASTDVFEVTAEGFDAEGLKQLRPGESLQVTVQPKAGLGYNKDAYIQDITVPNNNGLKQELKCTAKFRVKKATLSGVNTNMGVVEGLANGTPKTAKDLKLPASTTIYTLELGELKTGVQWYVDTCDYDPSSTKDQRFTVYGKVLLPNNVANPIQLSLNTYIEVSVNAYDAKKADPSENQIKGIENGATYKMEKSITMKFQAVGAGMTNTSPRKGDVRYLPYDWKVGGYGEKFDTSDYKDSFKVTKANKYTLKVNFIRQEYNGEKWVKKGDSDTKKVEFIIQSDKDGKDIGDKAAKKPTPTPKTKSAVNTGDETPIGAWVAVFVVAVGCIVGIVVYQKKKGKK